ncbi:MAG: hypothetical protein KGJ01_03645, partial [Patescibacteria group bacterium]|nr:hypothetical protein [Patescibacteria group bacterium]
MKFFTGRLLVIYLILLAFVLIIPIKPASACFLDPGTGDCWSFPIYSPGSYTTCSLSQGQCDPGTFAGETCNNGPSNTNSGTCGNSCGEGNPWTQYQTVCAVSTNYFGGYSCGWG